jgi:membrane-bound lytic murein transglycosylase D
MRARPSRRVLALLLLLALAIPMETAALGAEDCRGLVDEAQALFETGNTLYRQGHREMALQMFDKSHSLLLKADTDGDASLHDRLEGVFDIFYDLLSPMLPEMVEQLRAARRQVDTTFNEQAVYAGHVRDHIRYLVNERRQFLLNSYRKSYKYIPMIREEFERQGIPADLAYMALIESGFNPSALSHVGARGMWQFMPETARRFGLEVSEALDERLDPRKATEAAARYLKVLYAQFGNWPLAVAAYNCGENRVSKAMKRHGARSFWELVQHKALPLETRKYVPSIIAVTLISRDMERYGLPPMP